MPGEVKTLINHIITQRSAGNQEIAHTIMAKLILRGIDPSMFTDSSPDAPLEIEKVKSIACEMGVET